MLLLPVVLVLVLATIGAAYWLVYNASIPPRAEYLVTPEKYSRLSERGARITEETWANKDNTNARGWLLRGAEGAPAVVLLHRFGADRSWELNLGVKLNESTNFTVLMPDLRGHGNSPAVKYSSFGGCETDDVEGAIAYLRGLKTDANGKNLVGRDIGIYGTEIGGYAALLSATKEQIVTAIVADSVPPTPDALLRSTVKKKSGFVPDLSASLASFGSMFYFSSCYQNKDINNEVRSLTNRNILLLAGKDAPEWSDSTANLQKSLGKQADLQVKTDLSISGYNIVSTTSEQSDNYDRLIIEFFKKSLGNSLVPTTNGTTPPTPPTSASPTNPPANTTASPANSTDTTKANSAANSANANLANNASNSISPTNAPANSANSANSTVPPKP